uniref:BCL7-like protein n=1 Tax=Setaria digitata TaxID=48799 RepID=A0A915Q3W4_9BILA
MYARSQRAETRNRAKDELKRVINSVDKVRKWEKKWIVVKDTQIKLFRWVPVTATANITKIPQKPMVQDQDESTTIASSENTQDSTALGIILPAINLTVMFFVEENSDVARVRAFGNLNDDSNTGFSEGGFDSDSNQTFEAVGFQGQTSNSGPPNGSTDFSEMRQREQESSEIKS